MLTVGAFHPHGRNRSAMFGLFHLGRAIKIHPFSVHRSESVSCKPNTSQMQSKHLFYKHRSLNYACCLQTPLKISRRRIILEQQKKLCAKMSHVFQLIKMTHFYQLRKKTHFYQLRKMTHFYQLRKITHFTN